MLWWMLFVKFQSTYISTVNVLIEYRPDFSRIFGPKYRGSSPKCFPDHPRKYLRPQIFIFDSMRRKILRLRIRNRYDENYIFLFYVSYSKSWNKIPKISVMKNMNTKLFVTGDKIKVIKISISSCFSTMLMGMLVEKLFCWIPLIFSHFSE